MNRSLQNTHEQTRVPAVNNTNIIFLQTTAPTSLVQAPKWYPLPFPRRNSPTPGSAASLQKLQKNTQ